MLRKGGKNEESTTDSSYYTKLSNQDLKKELLIGKALDERVCVIRLELFSIATLEQARVSLDIFGASLLDHRHNGSKRHIQMVMQWHCLYFCHKLGISRRLLP